MLQRVRCTPTAALVATLLATLLAAAGVAIGADWPQFLGPDRTGVSKETGLLEAWPPDGPKELWRVSGGPGMSGLSIARGLLVTLVERDGKQVVIALDAATGASKWSRPIAPAYENEMGDGPRAQPTIVDGDVFVLGGDGVLAALGLDEGKVRWQHDVIEELGGQVAEYGMACSPLVAGANVIVTVGCPDACVVAFDRQSGKLAWKAGSGHSGYSSPALLTLGGLEQVVVFNGEALIGILPSSGETLWRYPYETNFHCNIATPLEYDGKVFISSGENHGCALLSVQTAGEGSFNVKEAWTSFGPSSVLRCEWQTPLLLDGRLYGFDNVGGAGPVTHYTCVDIGTGKRVWQQARFGKGNAIAADGKLFATTLKGELVLMRANADGFAELGRKKVLGATRQAPALANARLYVRDNQEIVCFDVARAR